MKKVIIGLLYDIENKQFDRREKIGSLKSNKKLYFSYVANVR